jgi:hypothetical protein
LGDLGKNMKKGLQKDSTLQLQSFFATRADSTAKDLLLYAKSANLLSLCVKK